MSEHPVRVGFLFSAIVLAILMLVCSRLKQLAEKGFDV